MLKVDNNCECWCGSNRKFGECCGKIINDKISFLNSIKAVSDYVKEEDYDNVLKVEIANYVDYMIKVKSHTEPMVLQDSNRAKFLVEIDIKALSERFDSILSIIHFGNMDYDFEKLLSKAKSLFFNSAWHERTAYYLVLWLSFYKNNKERVLNT